MSEKNIVAQIEEALDNTLRKANVAEDEKRAAERALDQCRRTLSMFEEEAQRLRVALYAMTGETSKTLSDVGSDNRARRNELKKEPRS